MLVRGYASIFDIPDKTGDIVVPGAFTDWIKSTGGAITLPVYWMHDYNPQMGGDPTKVPIGSTNLLKQDRGGLYFEAKLAGFPKAAEIAELVTMGAARGSSIGYTIPAGGAVLRDDNRYLTKINLAEISVTATGIQMHPDAYVEPLASGSPIKPVDIDNHMEPAGASAPEEESP
jgi:hypothetical protein